jgi:hypothetical protein
MPRHARRKGIDLPAIVFALQPADEERLVKCIDERLDFGLAEPFDA